MRTSDGGEEAKIDRDKYDAPEKIRSIAAVIFCPTPYIIDGVTTFHCSFFPFLPAISSNS
tara:strand:+ start:855 stop:1034 length:180 start_codon:yes stop_codon:yes gene_type:complete